MNDKIVQAYLQKNPDFLINHPQILIDLNLPPQVKEGNLSIIDYQVKLLKERYQTLDAQLADLIDVAKFNELSQLQTQQFILKIIKQTDRKSLDKLMQITLAKKFKLAQSKLIIWSEQRHIKAENKRQLLRYIDQSSVYFGSINEPESRLIFDKHPKSIALVPLKSTRYGLLALASSDERFSQTNISEILLSLIANVAYIILQGIDNKS